MIIQEATVIALTEQERCELVAMIRSPKTEQGFVERARIVLLAAEGRSTRSIRDGLDACRAVFGHDRQDYGEALRLNLVQAIVAHASFLDRFDHGDGRYARIVRTLDGVKLPILDDWDLEPLDAQARHDLLEMHGFKTP